ncbi:AAA family ATPase [Thioflexithrix psekupsensis]|uniref:Novel STAND NTPase 1 domain-containing protein n=1 Tax=Thioflexithrix psekupsensis TaxID=1570016 RepID=A0A251X4P3_9GAMM|nr:AAA family ATPase [Thioflexithrix psekupsensis]OUD12068.1 hypothetical protein TPSD3_13100 [Thioflexithrix psekupsensis]
MNLEQHVFFIKQHLLDRGGYTVAAKECIEIIEHAFRQLLLRHFGSLDENTQKKIRDLEKQTAKGGRGKSIQDFTLGQLLGIIRDSDFINAWGKAKNKDFLSIRLLNFDELTKLRNPLIHEGKQATPEQAQFLYYSLQLLIESFGIKNLEKGSELNIETLPHLVKLDNPYRGLESFRQAHAQQFFGRDKEIEALKAWVMQRSFVAVIGNSGSGKSSLVFAGLIPKLNDWLIVECRPQDRAVYQLAAALIDGLYQTEINQVARFSEIRTLTTELAKDATLIQDVLVRIRTQHAQSKRFLVAIDQFEELYTLNSPTEQHQFIALLLQMVQSSQPLCVLITLRADFLTAVLNHNEFAKLFDTDRHKLLGNLGNDELLAAITQPLTAQGLRFEEELPQRIMRELGGTSGQLPLLQFTLQQLWEQRTGELLSHLSYENLGGVSLALARHADAIYQGFSEEGQLEIRCLFIQLVQPGEGTEDTRKVAELSQFDKAAQQAVIRRLADARLLVTSEHNVEVTHEALIRYWKPVRDWMQEDRPFRVWQEGLQRYLQDNTLLSGAALATAQEWLEKRPEEIRSDERALIERSVEKIAQDQAEKERQTRLLKEHLDKALITQSLFLADLARQAMENDKPATAMRLALEALSEYSETYPNRPFVAHAYNWLSRGINRQFQGTFEHETSVSHAVFSPDGTRLLTTSGMQAFVWDMKTGQLLLTLQGHSDSVNSAAYSPDGTRIVTASRDATARVWDALTGREICTLQGHESYVKSAIYSPDGTRIVTTASYDKTAHVWDALTGQEILTLQGHEGWVDSAVYSPNGTRIVTVSLDYTAHVWDALTGQEILTLRGHERAVTSAAYSPDGTRIVTASMDKTARVWDALTGQEILILRGHEGWVNSATYSPDGRQIVTASGGWKDGEDGGWEDSKDNTSRVWDAQTGQEILTLQGHEGYVYSAVYSPDGTRIVTASQDATARVWDAQTGQEIRTLRGHEGCVYSAVYSPDGTRIVTASSDKPPACGMCRRDRRFSPCKGIQMM